MLDRVSWFLGEIVDCKGLIGRVPSSVGEFHKREEDDMTHNGYEDYRNAWDSYKGLVALNLILFKLLLIWVQLCLLIH